MAAAALAVVPLAATGEAAKSGPLGLAVILFFCVACYFLFKSMSKHLRKVREEFPVDSDDDVPPSAGGPAVPASASASASASESSANVTPEEPSADVPSADLPDADVPDAKPSVEASTDTERPTATS